MGKQCEDRVRLGVMLVVRSNSASGTGLIAAEAQSRFAHDCPSLLNTIARRRSNQSCVWGYISRGAKCLSRRDAEDAELRGVLKTGAPAFAPIPDLPTRGEGEKCTD